jgi:hypothetical protein
LKPRDGKDLAVRDVLGEPHLDALSCSTAQLVDRALGHDPPGRQDGHAIGGSLHLAEDVRGEENRGPGGTRLGDHGQELVLWTWRRAG